VPSPSAAVRVQAFMETGSHRASAGGLLPWMARLGLCAAGVGAVRPPRGAPNGDGV